MPDPNPAATRLSILSLAVVLLATTSICSFSQSPPDAKEIIRISDEKFDGKTNQSEMTMTIVRPDWSREMSMKAWAKGQELSLILITAPARDKGITFLKRNKELWNWQPSIDRVIKLPPSMMMQSWMGSDFTNDDLVQESSVIDDYDHRLLGDTLIDGYDCYKIEMIPHEDAAVVWGKIYTWIDKKQYLQLKVEFYDEDGLLVSTMTAGDIKAIGGRVIPTRMEMVPADEEGHKTVITYQHIVFDEDLDDDLFTVQQMKRIRP